MIILLSGGLDSTALAALAAQGRIDDEDVQAVSFYYGQRHGQRELEAANAVARFYAMEHDVVDLSDLGRLLSSSALTAPGASIPEGHYAEDNMRATVVPNRNAIMLQIAAGIAASRGHRKVLTAVHAGDHPIYPDCRPVFIAAASRTSALGTKGHGDVYIEAPFVNWSKAQIVEEGARLGAPFHLTWSCYVGAAFHCGRCGTCVERAEAFVLAAVADPTTYADPDFWRQAVAAKAAEEASA